MKWDLIDSGFSRAENNMAIDYELLASLTSSSNPMLHLYDWMKPSVTYGHFIEPTHYFDFNALEKNGIEIARRPTGGGIIFHQCDLAFSVIVPLHHPGYSLNTLENYQFVNEKVREVLKLYWGGEIKETMLLIDEECSATRGTCHKFCMAKPTKYDVMIQGRKIGGAAQRRTKQGFLHQGSISIGLLDKEYIQAILGGKADVADAMYANSFPLLGMRVVSEDELSEARNALKNYLKEVILTG